MQIILRTGHGREVDWWSLGTLFYDMMMGAPPFTGLTRKATIDKILKGRIRINPEDMSDDAKSLIKGLLKRNVAHRLGAGPTDAEEIKEHPFFSDIDWDLCKARQVSRFLSSFVLNYKLVAKYLNALIFKIGLNIKLKTEYFPKKI